MSATTTFYNDPEADDAVNAAEAILFSARNGVMPDEAERQYGQSNQTDEQQDDGAIA